MKAYFKIFFLALSAILLQDNNLFAQHKIERKIIIQNGKYFFFTVDEESQLATLCTGFVYEKMNKVKRFPMPIGREFNEPFIPLCFDINATELIGINWILNSNNDRNEALKKINLSNWKSPRKDWTNEQWAQESFGQEILVANEPWDRMLAVSNILDNTFFDLVKNDVLTMAVCNQNQLWISRYINGQWKTSASIPVNFKQYFSLIERNGKVFLADNLGTVYGVDELNNSLLIKIKSTASKPQLLIIDKDHHSNYLIPAEALEAGQQFDLEKIIKDSATEIIF